MKDKENRVQVMLRISADMHREITAIAEREEESMSLIVRRLLRRGLEYERARVNADRLLKIAAQ